MMSLLLFWWIFSAAPTSLPASLPFPLDAPEEGRLVAIDTEGRQRWRARWSMEPLMKDGLDMVRLTEEGPPAPPCRVEPLRAPGGRGHVEKHSRADLWHS